MKPDRLQSILAEIPKRTVLLVGDFFLDKYLMIDPALAEISLETGLEAHQVVQVRCSPGAAGTVSNNLRALGAGVMALGVIGDDGEGFELIRGLDANGVDVDNLVVRPDRFTPTYTKPMAIAAGGPGRELNRLDIKNRASLPEAVEDQVIRRLRSVLPRVHAVLVSDQVQEENCGVITERVREEICSLARTYPSVVFAVDSRERIGLFEDVILKPNEREASRAVLGPAAGEAAGPDESLRCGEALYRRSGQPVFLTLGEKGMVAFHEGGPTWAPAVPVTGPLDIVGAGDSALSGIVAALSAGATVPEAAEIGCLAAGVTVRQIGTTGTASREQIAACLVEAGAGWGPAALPIA